MIRKLVAIVVSVLVNCAVLAMFHVWTTPTIASAPPPQHTPRHLRTLPVVTVRPTQAQIEALHRDARHRGETNR